MSDDLKRWCAPATGARDPLAARDLLVECFRHAQAETFARQRERLGVAADEEAVDMSIRGAVRAALSSVGGDFDHPTKEHLAGAVEVLARKARTWGTPDDIVDHHLTEMRKVIERLP